MALNGFPVDHSMGYFAGLASSNAMDVEGIKTGDNLLAVVSMTSAGVATGHDPGDFTVGSGTLTAGTIDLSGQSVCLAIWTNAPAS